MRRLIGYFIRRTWKDCPPGKTLVAQTHPIYPTRADAERELTEMIEGCELQQQFEYDIAQAWMIDDQERNTEDDR